MNAEFEGGQNVTWKPPMHEPTDVVISMRITSHVVVLLSIDSSILEACLVGRLRTIRMK